MNTSVVSFNFFKSVSVSQEAALAVPKLASSAYGNPNRLQTDYPSRTHCHMEVCQQDFFRLTGTNIGKEE